MGPRPSLSLVTQRIVEEHEQIHVALGNMTEALDWMLSDGKERAQLGKLKEHLTELLEMLRKHFQAEEVSGLFPIIRELVPEAQDEVTRLSQ